MSKLMSLKLLAIATLLLAWSGVSTAGEPAPVVVNPADVLIQDAAIKEIRITAIPDSDAKAIEEKCNLLAEYLTKKVGIHRAAELRGVRDGPGHRPG